MRRTASATTVVLAVFVIANCSGSQPLSRMQLVQRANAICHQRHGQMAVAERGASSLRGAIAKGLPIAIQATRKLESLKPPSELKSTFTRLIALEKASQEELRRRLASGNWKTNGEEHPHELTNLATRLGLRECL